MKCLSNIEVGLNCDLGFKSILRTRIAQFTWMNHHQQQSRHFQQRTSDASTLPKDTLKTNGRPPIRAAKLGRLALQWGFMSGQDLDTYQQCNNLNNFLQYNNATTTCTERTKLQQVTNRPLLNLRLQTCGHQLNLHV